MPKFEYVSLGLRCPPDESTMVELADEIVRARAKFPGSRFLLAALTEEVGELARAILQRKTGDEIKREAIQVACVALRIYEEGDSAFDGLTDEESKP